MLTYSVDKADFKCQEDSRFTIEVLREEDAREVIVHAAHAWSPEFIRERIRRRSFRGVYEGRKLVSWLGTLWEGANASEIGFAFTRKEHRGRGMMKTLTSLLTEEVLHEGKVPILHTVQENLPAVRVVESLGYSLKAREWAYFWTP